MARTRRQTQWIDASSTSLVALAGAVAPGTIVNETIISEGEFENLGKLTVTRIVGEIWISRTAGSPVVTATLLTLENYPGAVFPVDYTPDVWQRPNNMWSAMWHGTSATDGPMKIPVDVRSQRKMGQGHILILAMQNHSIAGQDAQYTFHLRALVKLA